MLVPNSRDGHEKMATEFFALDLYVVLLLAPDMHRLKKIVIPRIISKWKDVAYSMRYKIYDVDATEIECNHVLRDCCQHLFSKWLTTRLHPTWGELLDYIKDVDDLEAADEEIEKKLVSGS